jgi:ABC-type antimicrobial peptide transport system permease subunit
MVQKKFEFLSPFLMVCGAIWVAVLSALNVRERRPELGIWRALGKGGGFIGGLVIGKAMMVGLLGGFLGFWVGNLIALEVGPRSFKSPLKRSRRNGRIWFGHSFLRHYSQQPLLSFLPCWQ